jgi:catechol-2,3-dioxygenase
VGYFQSVAQVNLRVRDLQKAIEWYQTNLGLRLCAEYEGHTAILDFGQEDSGSTIVCLIKLNEDEELPINSKNGTYPVFKLSPEYAETIYDELKGKGVSVEDSPNHKAHFKFYDLDRNQIEVYLPGIYEV